MKRIAFALACACLLLTGAADPSAAGGAADSYTKEDVRHLQSYLVGENTPSEPYDLNGDGVWDILDLALMKHSLAIAPEAGSDTIVVYFSQTGNTEKIAEYLTGLTGADVYEIEAAVPYSDEDIAYNNSGCRANLEQNDKSVRPEIASPIASLDGYDTVFLGYPIWW